jgi:uncharacterized repeat protein (TIGR03803 family)
LFGVTASGGKNQVNGIGAGVVYEFAPDTRTYSVLYDFCSQIACTDGKNPYLVKLVIDVAGNLYGTAQSANAQGGVVFELVRKKSGWQERILHAFCSRRLCKDGGTPLSGLTYAGSNTGAPYDGVSPLYGTTFTGGANGNGTVFRVMPREPGSKKRKEDVLYSFCAQANCTDGSQPDAPLILDGSGNIYGTTPAGGAFNQGTIFKLSPQGDAYTQSVLYGFCAEAGCIDGTTPAGGLTFDSAGNLFGTALGGAFGRGVVFKLAQNGADWNYATIADFDGTNGSGPLGGVIVDADGSLVGTTYQGGEFNKGTVFKFDGAIKTLYSFQGRPDGRHPFTGMTEDANGNLFGTTFEGGPNRDSGTIYQLTP